MSVSPEPYDGMGSSSHVLVARIEVASTGFGRSSDAEALNSAKAAA